MPMPSQATRTGDRTAAAPSRAGLFAALGVLLTGALLRFWNLPRQGITNYDEAVHLLEARFLRAGLARNLLGRDVPLDGLPLMHGKPLHSALIALAQTLFGDHPWTGALVSALFGAVAILLVYDLGRRIWGETEGLLAAALLAGMPWSLLYGRMALAESDSTCLVLLAVGLQAGAWPGGLGRGPGGRGPGVPRTSGVQDPGARPAARSASGGSMTHALLRLRRPALAGTAAGLAFLCNYRWGPLLLLLFAGIEWARLRREPRGRWLELPARVVAFLLPAALLVLVTDAAYGLGVLGPLLDAQTRPRTYLEDLAHNIGKFERMGIGLRDPLRLPLFLWIFGGPVLIAGLIAAAGFASRKAASAAPGSPAAPATSASSAASAVRPAALAGVVLLAGIPVLLFLFTPNVFPRSLSAALPAWALLGGWGLARLAHRLPGSVARTGSAGLPVRIAVPVAVLLVAVQAALGAGVWMQRSGYGEAAAWLRAHGAARCLSTQAYALCVYGIDAAGVPQAAGALSAAPKAGYRYLLLDNQAWIGPQAATCRAVRATMRPVAAIPHPSGGDAAFVWEAPQSSVAAGRARSEGPDWLRPSEILIYDLAAGMPGGGAESSGNGPR